MYIPFLSLQKITESFEPVLSQKINKVVKNGWYVHGEECKVFEKNFAQFCGVKYCIGVGNGLEALKLILRAYKLLGVFEEGDEIIEWYKEKLNSTNSTNDAKGIWNDFEIDVSFNKFSNLVLKLPSLKLSTS